MSTAMKYDRLVNALPRLRPAHHPGADGACATADSASVSGEEFSSKQKE